MTKMEIDPFANEPPAPRPSPVTEHDFYGMSEVELLSHCGDKAERWAEAFCQIKSRQGWSAADIDKGLMLCWFANAIEHSNQVRDEAAARCSAGTETPSDFEQVFRDACDEAGCGYDNELLLTTIKEMRDELQMRRAADAMYPNDLAQGPLSREAVLKAVLEAQDCGIGDTGPDGKWRRIACNDDSLKGDRNYFREGCECSRTTDAVLALSSTERETPKG